MQHASPLFSSLSLSLPYDALFRSTRRTASVMVLSAKGGVVGVWWIDHVDHCLVVVHHPPSPPDAATFQT